MLPHSKRIYKNPFTTRKAEAETFPQLPVGLVLTPSLHSVDVSVGSIHQLDGEICNFTEHEITLPAKSVLCCVHNAKLYQRAKCSQQQKDRSSTSTTRLTDEEFIQQFELGTSLSPEEEKVVNELLLKWRGVFSCPGEKLGCTTSIKTSSPIQHHSKSPTEE